MVGPNYQAPENNVADQWSTVETGEISKEEPLIAWWRVFNDPLLDKYIELAVDHNNTILAAEDNILQARALRQVAASSLFPQVNGYLDGDRMHFSKNGLFFGNPVTTAAPPAAAAAAAGAATSPFKPTTSVFTALFDASWELDLFGKTRRSVQAADANIGLAIEKKRDALISVMAEIARNYIEIRSTQRNTALVEENIELLERNAEIVRQNFAGGLYNKLNLETIEANLAAARSVLPDLYAQILSGIYSISILTGNVPETLMNELLVMRPLPSVPDSVAVGLRSDLLRRRPDVRASERQLANATANLGVAVASFFPTISLLGLGGLQSLKIKDLFQLPSRTWLAGGGITIPIFQGGQLVGNLRSNRASVSSAAHNYQQTVLTALQDAETALTNYTHDLKAVDQWKENTFHNKKLTQLTEQRYTQGLVGLIDYLTIQQQLVTAEQNLLQSRTKSLVDLIALYKALGGGWQVGD